MNIRVHYSRENELTLFVGRGSLTADDFIAALENHFADRPTNNVVWDLCGSDLSNIDVDALNRMSDYAFRFAAKRRNPRTCFTVKQEQERYLMKLYSEISALRGSPVRYDCFGSLREAFEALAIENPFAEAASACP